MQFHLGSAGDLRKILEDRGLPMATRIVSGLPFASLPAKVQDDVVDGVTKCLNPHGDFRTFQYMHAYGMRRARRFRALMDERFTSFERIGPVIRNLPPAYVLRYWNALPAEG
jgi:phospholipid N-methyltransferase